MGVPLPVPQSIRREVQADRVIITRTWREGGGVVGLILVAVIWNSVMIAMYRSAEIEPDWVWAWFLIPWALGAIGIYLVYASIATLLNTTEVEISPDLLSVTTGPVPWHREIRLAPAEIQNVIYLERAERGYSSTYDVAVVTASGGEKRLIKRLNQYEVAVFYVREIRSILGLPNVTLSPDA